MFDFSKFTQEISQSKEGNNITAEVSAEKSEPAEVIQDIAKEVNTNATTSEVSEMTPEKIKEQAEFLKKQKEVSEDKEEKSSKSKTSSKKKSKKEEKKEAEKVKEEPIEWSRERPVVAYGQQVYTEVDGTVNLEGIREKLVNQYGFSEFKDSNRCQMRFDAKTGEVYPEITFNKKG